MFRLSFDPASLAEIAQLYGFQAILNPEFQAAMQESGSLLAKAAQDMTWVVFANPSGALADTITPVVDSPYEVQIGSDSPYARRRELGFMGKIDSLGRGPFNDPAKPYTQPALDEHQTEVLTMLQTALQAYMDRMAAGG